MKKLITPLFAVAMHALPANAVEPYTAETKAILTQIDFDHLTNVKDNVVKQGLAISSGLSTWHHSVDMTIGSRNPDKADALADQICHQAKLNLYDKTWSVRVYFADGTLASECRITD